MMQRLLLSLLATLFLLGQLGLIAHASEEHDNDSLCELCVAAHHQNNALPTSSTQIHFDSFFIYAAPSALIGITQTTKPHFSARAPPYSL